MSDPPKYVSDPEPGTFDHRSGDCEIHGENVPTFRARGYIGPFYCVECALNALAKENELVPHER